MIADERYYRPRQLLSLHPAFDMDYKTLLKFIRQGRLVAVNTSTAVNPRYRVRGSDALAFIESIKVAR